MTEPEQIPEVIEARPKRKRRMQSRPSIEKRIAEATRTVATPEVRDALELTSMLDADLVRELAQTIKELPPGAQYDEARGNELLSVQARHDLIVRLRAQGMHPSRIARSIGVTTQTVTKVVTRYFSRKEQDLRSQRMDEFILLMAEGYLEDIDRLSDIISRSSHVAAIVGAIKARQEARQKYVDLLADFGFIARKPTEVHVSGDGTIVDARTQNVIVVDADTLKSLAKDMLAKRRLQQGEPSNDSEDARIADLVVYANDPT